MTLALWWWEKTSHPKDTLGWTSIIQQRILCSTHKHIWMIPTLRLQKVEVYECAGKAWWGEGQRWELQRQRHSSALIWAPVDARMWRAGLQPPLGRPEAEPMDRGGESMQRVAAAKYQTQSPEKKEQLQKPESSVNPPVAYWFQQMQQQWRQKQHSSWCGLYLSWLKPVKKTKPQMRGSLLHWPFPHPSLEPSRWNWDTPDSATTQLAASSCREAAPGTQRPCAPSLIRQYHGGDAQILGIWSIFHSWGSATQQTSRKSM